MPNPQDPSARDFGAQDPDAPGLDSRGSRRPSPRGVALVLIGIVLVLAIGAYALVTAWIG